MYGFPPFMPSDLLNQRIYVIGTVPLMLALFASLWWQWKRPPSSVVTIGWIVGIVLAFCLGRAGSMGGFSAAVLLFVLGVQVLVIFTGLLRNAFRSPLVSVDSTVIVLIVVAAINVLQPRLGSREGAWHSRCKNNLKLIGLLIWDSSELGTLAPNSGSPPVSWRVTSLPGLLDRNEKDFSQGYDVKLPWNNPSNLNVARQEASVFRCPSNREYTRLGDLVCTDYALVTGPGTIFPTASDKFAFANIPDGATNTILAVECSGLRIPWTEPRDVDITREHLTVDELAPDGSSPSILSSFHASPNREYQSVHILFADGSVRAISPKSVSPELLRKLTTAQGGEPIDEEF